jgi:hypothetical protein
MRALCTPRVRATDVLLVVVRTHLVAWVVLVPKLVVFASKLSSSTGEGSQTAHHAGNAQQISHALKLICTWGSSVGAEKSVS